MTKIELIDDFQVEINMSAYHQEVQDYLINQLPDRLWELKEHELEISTRNNHLVTITIPILGLVYKIIEEKIADMHREERDRQ